MEKRRHLDILMGLLGIILFIGLIMACFYEPTGYKSFPIDPCRKMKDSFHVVWGDNEMDTTLPATIKNPKKQSIFISRVLHEKELGQGDSILFRSRQSRAKVYLDDTLIYDSGEAFKMPFSMGYGSLWKGLQIGNDYDGKKLTIELQPGYKMQDVSGYLPEVYFGTRVSFIKMILEKVIMTMILTIIMIGMGGYYIANGLFAIHKTKSVQMFFLGLFSVDTGVWMLTESHTLELFINNMQPIIYLGYITFGLMPVLLIRFLLGWEEFGSKMYLKLLYFVGIILNLIQIFMAAVGICMQFESQWLNRVYLVLTVIGLLAALFSVRKIETLQRRRRLYAGILILVISTILELLYFLFVNKVNSGRILLMGICLFIFTEGFNLIRDGRKLRKEDLEKEILQKMAYTDGMTKLGNRFAYELEKNNLEVKKDTQVKVLIADMNGLKLANDNYGHSYGDQVICKTAELLEASFQNVGKCYRIGGDEFCVLAENIDSEVFENCMETMQEKASKLQDTIKGYGIAYGVACGNAQDIEDIFHEADNLMYTCKRKMKKIR